MRFNASVGVLPHERELPQPVEVDLTVRRAESGDAPPDDLLDDSELYELAASARRRPRVRYLEEIASAVASAALATATVERARVALRKPHLALPGPPARSDVAVDRERE